MRDLFVVTHPQSIHHIEKKVGGWYDTGLTERGREDAAAVAERLFGLVGDKEIEIVSSDLQRAAQTAAIIGSRFMRPVTTTEALLRSATVSLRGCRRIGLMPVTHPRQITTGSTIEAA